MNPSPTANNASSHLATLSERSGVLQNTDWAASVTAGIAAGIAYVAVVSLFGLGATDSAWGPAHRIAAIVLGPSVLATAPGFPPQVVVVATALHLVLSALYGVLVGWLVHSMHTAAALAVGLAFGLVMFGINFYVVAPTLFPWFVEVRTLSTALANALFGVLVAGTYVTLRRPRSGPTRVWRQSEHPNA